MGRSEELMTAMKEALSRASSGYVDSAAQARRLRAVVDCLPPEEVAHAFVARDGASFADVVRQTCSGLNEMRQAYGDLHETLVRRRAELDQEAH